MNYGRAVYYCEKKVSQWKSLKKRLEKKWLRILIICHIMLESTEKFHFFEA
jgi:hypothetical protein